jgi:ribosomal protein L3 glutamine methyltransferase
MKTLQKLKTVDDCVRFAVRQFRKAKIYFGHGTDNAWDEALFLILHALNLPQDTDKTVLQRLLNDDEKTKIIDLVRDRIEKRTPAAYLMHESWFAGLSFYVDERVLIPRSPLAELIVDQFGPWVKPENVHNILDIGTGSGCIAIACAHYFSEAHVDATDISVSALEVAKINIAKHKMEERVQLWQSDVFASLPKKKYDVIISNPPYATKEEMQDLPQEYYHEPSEALIAGEDGLQVVDRILQEAADYLAPQGILVVEVGNSAPALIDKHPKLPFIWLDFAEGESEVFLLTRQDLIVNAEQV